jgi:tetratricopeptide (TPR) repeat protein
VFVPVPGLLAFALAGAALGAQGQSATTAPPWLTRLSSYLEAVNEHVPGEVDRPARVVAFWTELDLEFARTDYFALVALCRKELSRTARPRSVVYKNTVIEFGELRALLGLTEAEAANGDVNRTLVRAAVLHADIARGVIPKLSGDVGCAERGTFLVNDGETTGRGCLGIHWIQGRMLLDGVRPDPGSDESVRLWYLATIVYLLEAGDYANAEPVVSHSQLLFPDDPDVLFQHGYYHEGFASPFIQSAALESGNDRRGPKTHLEEAADHYRKALKARPDFAEARLHLGFVLTELGRDDDAAGELRRAVRDLQDSRHRYLADLFLGHAEYELGHAEPARDHFRRASDRCPQAQSPLLSLALVARQQEDRRGALEAMQKLLELPRAVPDEADPWWHYLRWQSQASGPFFRELYARVRREGQP